MQKGASGDEHVRQRASWGEVAAACLPPSLGCFAVNSSCSYFPDAFAQGSCQALNVPRRSEAVQFNIPASGGSETTFQIFTLYCTYCCVDALPPPAPSSSISQGSSQEILWIHLCFVYQVLFKHLTQQSLSRGWQPFLHHGGRATLLPSAEAEDRSVLAYLRSCCRSFQRRDGGQAVMVTRGQGFPASVLHRFCCWKKTLRGSRDRWSI